MNRVGTDAIKLIRRLESRLFLPRAVLKLKLNPAYHGLIYLLCGALTLVLCTVWYMAYGKKHGFSFRNTGIAISGHALLKSIMQLRSYRQLGEGPARHCRHTGMS